MTTLDAATRADLIQRLHVADCHDHPIAEHTPDVPYEHGRQLDVVLDGLAAAGLVVVDRQTHSWLVEAALDQIWYGEQEEDSLGCCPTCCAPCAALKALLDAGTLDDAVRHRTTSSWWDATNGRVDRDWLSKAWRMTSCHED